MPVAAAASVDCDQQVQLPHAIEARVAVHGLVRIDTDRCVPAQKAAEHDPGLQACQRRAQAEVDAFAEGEMRIRVLVERQEGVAEQERRGDMSGDQQNRGKADNHVVARDELILVVGEQCAEVGGERPCVGEGRRDVVVAVDADYRAVNDALAVTGGLTEM
jgi:hypothetical protein